MSWLFSRALVEAFSEENSWDGEPCAQLNVMPTQHKFWRNDKTMEFSSLSRFGLTLHLLTESRGEELLMWYRAGFPVRTYPLPEKAQESPAQGRDSGKSLPGLLARYDPATHSLKTVQLSLLADLEPSSVTLPPWGSMRSGALYQRQMSALFTSENDSGFWPTPDCRGFVNEGSVQMLAKKVDDRDQWSRMAYRTAKSKKERIWPTPTAHNAKETNAPSEALRNAPTLASLVGGQLSADWTEWLMGWPTGWTDLKPLETGRCLCARQQHGKC